LKIKVNTRPPNIIAYNEAPSEATTARTFQKAVGCSFEEAKYYISECKGDYKQALVLYQADVAWEKKAR